METFAFIEKIYIYWKVVKMAALHRVYLGFTKAFDQFIFSM